MKKIKVLIVDDSAVIRNICTQILSSDPEIEVVGTAEDPFDARDKIKLLNPDVITLDVQMPRMDGLTFLEKIMTLRPLPVVMVSTLTEKGASATIKALELGAIDYVSKPSSLGGSNNLDSFKEELIAKVKIASESKVKPLSTEKIEPIAKTSSNFNPKDKIVAIGSSTGGVEALTQIILQLPANAPSILIAQHMPVQFTASFAKRLNDHAAVTVVEAQDQMTIEVGHVYIAPGGQHMRIIDKGTGHAIALDEGSLVNGHRPSVDVLFKSFASIIPKKTLAFILTGMGNDGALGCKELFDKGALTYGQNKDSCVVYGMPKAANELGAVLEELNLNQIAMKIMQK
jgi:two-component system chemotaxis response regulator CheB